MGTPWNRYQDTDFLARLTRLENFVSRYMMSQQFKYADILPYSNDELEEENRTLRTRIDDLEEMLITLGQEFSQLEERINTNN